MAKPIAKSDLKKMLVTDTTISGNILANDTDADGHAIHLRFLDNSRANTQAVNIVAGKYGIFAFNADGSYTYNLDQANPAVANAHGGNPLVERVSYKVSDGKGGTDFDFLTVKIYAATNARPHAEHDTFNVHDGLQTGNLLANDTDPDGDMLQVTYAGKSGSLHYIPDVSKSVVTVDGLYGKMTIGRDGHFTYEVDQNNAAVQALDSNHTLNDTLVYKIFDGGQTNSSDQDAVTFTIHHDMLM